MIAEGTRQEPSRVVQERDIEKNDLVHGCCAGDDDVVVVVVVVVAIAFRSGYRH